MKNQSMREQISRASEAFDVVVADTPKLRWEAYRLRYQVYGLERGYEPGDNGIEKDIYDDRSQHVLLIHRDSDAVVGTVRVVPSVGRSSDDFPMTNACRPGLLRHLPLHSTGEISRFAISKLRRLNLREHTLLRLGLMQGIVRMSDALGLTHWCAIMEPLLLRLLQMNAIHFSPLGPVIEYHGPRQPSCGHIHTILERIRREQWDVWNYITCGGSLARGNGRELMVA